ncbi:MAG: DNA primase DnaG [Candidatus Pacearchaeota archaeon]
MAKVSPTSIKYMIHANFSAEGALERPDIVGAIFGQTEGLLGAELDMRDLQKEGKIGRVEVDVQREGKRTLGKIKIPTALDQSETTLIGAAIETIERIGPADSQIEVENIEDVRGSKRDYILDRAKKLMQDFGSEDSKEISKKIKESQRTANIQKYGEDELPCGEIENNKEVVVVEGRADVVNMLKAGVNNVIAMNGVKLPETVKKLSQEKDITLFVDGDRGGKLIIQNVMDNANVKYVAVAPEGKEVEELESKESHMALRKKIPAQEYKKKYMKGQKASEPEEESQEVEQKTIELDDEKKEQIKEKFQENEGSEKTIFLDCDLSEKRTTSTKTLGAVLKRVKDKPCVLVIDGTATKTIINGAEEAGCQVVAAKNFESNSENLKLLSF